MLQKMSRKLSKATTLVRKGNWSEFRARFSRNVRPATAPARELAFLAHDSITHKYWANGVTRESYPSEVITSPVRKVKLGSGGRQGRKNVIWIVLDALRFDIFDHYLKRGGLSKLAPQSAYFPLTFAQGSWTYPSFFSFLSGRYPFNCGVTGFSSSNGTLRSVCRDFDDSCPTVFEILRRQGYRVQSILDGWDFTMRTTAGRNHSEDWYFEKHWGWSAFGRGKRFISLAELRKNTISSIDSAGSKAPFFLLIRSLYTHAPYRGIFDDPEYVTRLSRRGWIGRLVGGFVRGLKRWENDFLNPTLQALEDRNALDRTIIVISSDHGEMLWDLEGDLRSSPDSDESWRHQLEPYNALMRVPLLIWGAGVRGAYQGVFRLVDVVPTLLDCLGFEDGHETFDGISLFRPGDRPVYADSAGYGHGGVALYTENGKHLSSERLGDSFYRMDLRGYESLHLREQASKPDTVRKFVDQYGRYPDLIQEGKDESALLNRLRALGYVQ